MTAPLDIPAIRRRAEEAFTVKPGSIGETLSDDKSCGVRSGATLCETHGIHIANCSNVRAGWVAAARAASRDDVPALCDEVERLRALCGEAAGWLECALCQVDARVARLRAASEGKP